MDFRSSSSSQRVSPKTLSVIAAAVTEFLGKKVRVRSARMLEPPYAVSRWARQGRVTVQTSHNITQRGR
jgi:hypothetical protein